MIDCEYHNSIYLVNHHDDYNDDGEGSVHRLLASSSSSDEDVYLGYATIGVVVVTLALLFVVDVIRHGLDLAARGHLFFQTVLELIYREVTTLGFVELLLHLLHTMNIDLRLEVAFTTVHFMIFYTAIINAIQSCIVRLLAVRRTNKTWLVTEDIEIGHYVAIRKEFDRLERRIKQLDPRYVGGIAKRAWSTDSSDDVNVSHSSYFSDSFRRMLFDLAFKVRHPQLYRRRKNLLTVIRFHELRAHFIVSNNLPPKFKVSSYLGRSLTSALLDLVHISPAAWIMFIVICNLVFFIAGMILNNTESNPKVEEFLLYCLIAFMVVFVAIVTALYFKMRYIFYKMQQLKLSHQSIRPSLLSALHGGTTKSFDQLDLFWGSNPRAVIVIIQIMQFVYATGIAGVLSYYNAWPVSAAVKNYQFLLLLLFSYSVFIKLTSDILPWYTLCTSLGQLVHKEILHVTVAKQRLDEEIRKIVSAEEETEAEEEIVRRRSEIAEKNAKAASGLKGADSPSLSNGAELSRSMDSNHVDAYSQGFITVIAPAVGVEKDGDDVQNAMVSDETNVTRQGRTKALLKGIDLMAFFQSSRYRAISLLFGPTICFWIIARINTFNISEGLSDDQPATWARYLDDFFWCEVSWYCFMACEMFLVIAVCLNKRDRQGSRLSCFAAVLGLVIILLCMLLLFIAEAKRCCQNGSFDAEEIHEAESSHRLLASESSNGDYHDDYLDCCPKFGTRRYGGLGDIEPFTSLIVLYPMRFLCAWYIIAMFEYVTKKDQHDMSTKLSDMLPTLTSSHHVHHDIDSAKLRDMWLTATVVHSEVVGMFGMFSGEMLQCMLGIYSKKSIDDSKELGISIRYDRTPDNNQMVEHQMNHVTVQGEGTVDNSSRQPLNLIQSSSISSTDPTSPLKSSADRTNDTVAFDNFSYPTARLICKIRRCERVLFPLLDEWMVVDAVLTSHELILFNVLDDADNDHAVSSLTNGGEGLHLCDVAKSRKIVSQFSLNELSDVSIERRTSIAQKDISSDDVEVNYTGNLQEYWEGGEISSDDYQVSSMNERWGHVNEDRLKLRFKHQTLSLRFMVDLKEMERISHLPDHFGAEATLWCFKVARLRGVTNTRRRSLARSGSDFVDNFVTTCDRSDHERGHSRRNLGILKLQRHKSH